MCTPEVGLALTGVSTVMGVVSAQQQASAAQAQANYSAQVAAANQRIANQQAESAAVQGAQQAQQQTQKMRAIQGAQKAAYSAAGLDISSGSPLDVLADTEKQGQLDAANIKYNAALNVWDLQNQSNEYAAESQMYRQAADNAGTAGRLNMFSTLLTGASSYANQYMNYNGVGALKKKVNQ